MTITASPSGSTRIEVSRNSFIVDVRRHVRQRQPVAGLHAGFEFINPVRGNDDGPYVNMNFAAVDYIAGWLQLRTLFDDPRTGGRLAASTIIVCEGKDSWNDCLLLHHFDPNQKLDDVRLR